MNSENFIKFSRAFGAFEWARKNNPEQIISLQQTSSEFNKNIAHGISHCKIFEISDDIKRLLCLTDPPNRNDEVFLAFPNIFIDVMFTKEELLELGIEIEAKEIIGILFSEGKLVHEIPNKEGMIDVEVVGKDLNITIASLQKNDEFWFDNFNKNMSIIDRFKDTELDIKENPTTDKKAR